MVDGGMAMKDAIRRKARDLGFDAVGFAPVDGDWSADLGAFLAEGRQGDMGWLAERRDQRASAIGLWPAVRSVISLGTNYGPADDPLALAGRSDRGVISVYARNKDYHDLVKKRLKALARWMVDALGGDLKVFVDTAPVMEKPLAARSGLGWRGRHTNLVSRDFGSWLFLGEVYTTLDLPPDAAEPNRCGQCSACQDHCPTGAIEGFGRIDPRRCVSYLTIEHKGPIPVALRPLMGNRIYGCDDCLAVCPWNKFARPTQDGDLMPRIELTAPRLADLAALDDSAFREVFAASPIKRIGRGRLVRNVLIAIGNSGLPELAPVAARLGRDDDPIVADAAVWALARLTQSA